MRRAYAIQGVCVPGPQVSPPTTPRRTRRLTDRVGCAICSGVKYLACVAFSLSIAAGCAAGMGDDNTDGEQDLGSTQYVLIQDFSGVDQFAWFDLAHRINAEFATVCGATACANGELGAVRPLTFDCAVSSVRGSVSDCTWTFAAAKTGVDAPTAAIKVDAPTFQCHIHPRMYARALISTLANADTAILAPLPGMDGSLADSLATCFANPLGSTPFTVATTPATYVSAASYYTSAAGQAKWSAAVSALVAGFDRV